MTPQHAALSGGRWKELPFTVQMANVGSEVERALRWKAKNNPAYCEKALDRALELLDLTLESAAGFHRLRELARAREFLLDYFLGSNQYSSTEAGWRKYFFQFACAANKNR